MLLALLVLAGCGAGPAGAPDVVGEWQLAEGTADGAPLPRPHGAQATLELRDGDLRGRSFCNSVVSGYRLDGDSIEFDGLGGTDMGCDPDVMAAEQSFLDALGRVTTAARDGDDLVLSGDGVRLRLVPVIPEPDRPLEGTRWVLDTLVDGATASSTVGDPAGLVLDTDGTAEASTGCQLLTARWLLEDGALVLDDLLGSATCPPELADQDAHVTAVLGGGPAPVIQGDRLTLTTDDGRGLGYRAED